MALSYTTIAARMARDSGIVLLGLSNANAIKDVVVDAVNEYVRHMDRPIISSDLAVTASVGPYDVPTTINKIRDIRDAAGNPIAYTEDQIKNQITLQNAPADVATYKCYGTTKDNRTNIDIVIAAIEENNEDVLFAFIEAKALRWAKEDTAGNQLEYAKKLARDCKRCRNRTLNAQFMQKQYLDQRGYNIGDSDNVSGINMNINNQFASDLD